MFRRIIRLIGRQWTDAAIKNLSHRRSLPLAENRGPVPMAEMGPGFRREDEDGRIVLNRLYASKH